MAYLSIFLGGFLGTIARYSIGKKVGQFWQKPFPLGTLIINMSGSFIIGFLFTFFAVRNNIAQTVQIGMTTGFTGAYTTFSAFSYEALKLIEDREGLYLLMYIGSSLLAALLMVHLGIVVANLI